MIDNKVIRLHIKILVLLISAFFILLLSSCDNGDSKEMGCGIVKYEGQTAEQWADDYDNLVACVREHSDADDYDTLKSTADDCL